MVLGGDYCPYSSGNSKIASDDRCVDFATGFMAFKGRDEHWRQRHETTTNLELTFLVQSKRTLDFYAGWETDLAH